ncbi:MAG: nuclear transport factor 2 family protein [Rhodospirillales bacterium]
MRNRQCLVSTAVCLTALLTPPAVCAMDANDNAAVHEQLAALEKQSWVAWANHGGTFFSEFLSDDHVEVGSRGVTGKASVVAGVASPACKVESYTVGDFRFTRIAADTAVLVYKAEQKTTCAGTPVPSPAWATSVYVRRDGRWLNVLYQQTPAGG